MTPPLTRQLRTLLLEKPRLVGEEVGLHQPPPRRTGQDGFRSSGSSCSKVPQGAAPASLLLLLLTMDCARAP